jgi:hypothetical protein
MTLHFGVGGGWGEVHVVLCCGQLKTLEYRKENNITEKSKKKSVEGNELVL